MTPLDIIVFTASLIMATAFILILVYYLYKVVTKENRNEYELLYVYDTNTV